MLRAIRRRFAAFYGRARPLGTNRADAMARWGPPAMPMMERDVATNQHVLVGSEVVDRTAPTTAMPNTADPHGLCDGHPLFSYYGPRDPAWPRILVIGIAANAAKPICGHAGPYELRRRVPFWNQSHRIIGQAGGIPGLRSSLTKVAIDVTSSPVAYADASPVGIKVGADLAPPVIERAAYIANADRLLDLDQIRRDACPLAIISGSWNHPRAAFFSRVEKELFARRIPVVRVPFFSYYNVNDPVFVERLHSPDVRSIIHDVIAAWAQAERLPTPRREW